MQPFAFISFIWLVRSVAFCSDKKAKRHQANFLNWRFSISGYTWTEQETQRNAPQQSSTYLSLALMTMMIEPLNSSCSSSTICVEDCPDKNAFQELLVWRSWPQSMRKEFIDLFAQISNKCYSHQDTRFDLMCSSAFQEWIASSSSSGWSPKMPRLDRAELQS